MNGSSFSLLLVLVDFLFELVLLLHLESLCLSRFNTKSDDLRAAFVARAYLDVRGVVEPDIAILVLEKLGLHLQDLLLVNLLEVVRNLQTLLQRVGIVILWGVAFQQLIVVWQHTRVHTVFYLFFRQMLIDWCEKVYINWLADSPRFDTGLNTVHKVPLWVVRTHLKHVDEIYVFCNFHYLKVVIFIIIRLV